MRAKSVLLMLVIAVLLFACIPLNGETPPPADDKLAEVMARGTLVIATDSNYPPFSFLKPDEPRAAETKCVVSQYTANQLDGYDVQAGIAVARKLGLEPCFVTPQWNALVAGNWSNAWDIHFGSMTPTNERMEVLYFTQPYFATPIHIFVHRDNAVYQKPEDLSGKRIGTCAGCTYEKYLWGTLDMPGQVIVPLVADPQIVAYDNELPAFEDLELGDGIKLDAIVTQYSAGQEAIKSGKPLRMLEPALYFAYASAAVDKKSGRDPVSFVKKVSEIILELHREGTLSTLALQFLGADLSLEAAKFDLNSLNQFP